MVFTFINPQEQLQYVDVNFVSQFWKKINWILQMENYWFWSKWNQATSRNLIRLPNLQSQISGRHMTLFCDVLVEFWWGQSLNRMLWNWMWIRIVLLCWMEPILASLQSLLTMLGWTFNWIQIHQLFSLSWINFQW